MNDGSIEAAGAYPPEPVSVTRSTASRNHAALNRAHYCANKAYYVAKAKASRARLLDEKIAFIRTLIPTQCEECGEEISLESHRRKPRGAAPLASKSLRVMALHGWSVERIEGEVGASILVCPDCS